MRNRDKTVLFTAGLTTVSAAASIIVQLSQQSKLTVPCSYLDPIMIDFLAFLVTIFLIVEGIYRIWEHKDAALKHQITRAIRVALGASILAVHILQFVHK